MSRLADDDELMAELNEAMSTDVPPHRREAAYAAFAMRSLDQDLLTLSEESALAGAAVRGEGASQTMSFQGARIALEIEVEGERVLGQVLESRTTDVTLERPDGTTVSTVSDDAGFFSLAAGHGPVRFAVDVDGEIRRTEWFVL